MISFGAEPTDELAVASPLEEQLRARLPYALTEKDMSIVGARTQAEISRCMSSRGFDYEEIAGFELIGERWQHPLEESAIERYGFHPVPLAPFANPNLSMMADSDFVGALYGTDTTDGCETLASASVADIGAEYEDALLSLDVGLAESLNKARQGSRVVSAAEAYATCLSKRGFDPTEFAAERSDFEDAPTVTPAEVARRRVDFECDVGSRKTELLSLALRDAIRQFLETNASAVGEVVELKNAYLSALLSEIEE